MAEKQDNNAPRTFFAVKKYSQFDSDPPKYRTKEIGSYSMDIYRKFLDNKNSLRYYIQPENPQKVYFDLKKGFDTRMIQGKGRDINVLSWITNHMDEVLLDGETLDSKLDADFVTQRGVIRSLMLTPYEDSQGWFIAVTLFNGTYYLNEVESEEKKAREAKIKDDEQSCWGWKFEQYLTSDSENGIPNTDVPYNNCERFYTVVKSKLNKHSLVFSGEIDALKVDQVRGNSYVEFKTTKDYRMEQRHLRNFQRHKSLKWWVQSHIAGVKEIVCGFKDEDGVVKRLVTFKTESMPTIAQDSRDPWKPNMCLNYLDEFLNTIKSKITRDDYRIVHTLKWEPHQPVMISPPLRDSEYNFLPDWFVDRLPNSANTRDIYVRK